MYNVHFPPADAAGAYTAGGASGGSAATFSHDLGVFGTTTLVSLVPRNCCCCCWRCFVPLVGCTPTTHPFRSIVLFLPEKGGGGHMAASGSTAGAVGSVVTGQPSKSVAAFRSLELCDRLKLEIGNITSEIGYAPPPRRSTIYFCRTFSAARLAAADSRARVKYYEFSRAS